MKKPIQIQIHFVLFALLVLAHITPGAAAEGLRKRQAKVDPAIEKYVDFLEKQHQAPVDYILSLFEKADLVVLCERAHAEVTQYDLIYDLVRDPRFRKQAGHVFTEVGSSTLRPLVESLLMDESLSEEQVAEKLRRIAQNFDFEPVWEKTNIFDFLRKLHGLNASLERERRVRLYPSGIEFDWRTMTREGWIEFRKQLGRRDEIMAEHIISKFKELRQADPQAKALVIMNYRHAFPHLKADTGRRVDNTAGFLMDAFPGRVANVMINSVGLLNGTTDQRAIMTAVQEGKWDAAFAAVGNPGVSFDFQGSPFGEDEFDYFPFIAHHRRYQEAFTGFVFFKALEAHRQSTGLPGLIDETFAGELMRRESMTGKPTQAEIDRQIEELKTARVSTGYDEPAIAEKINQWLKSNP